MSKKISELTSANNLTGTEVIPIVQSGTTMKATVDLVRPTVATSITSSSTNSEVAGAKAVYDISLDNYSTTEQVVGTWIDGKPLYRVVIDDTFPNTTANGTQVQKDITLSSYKMERAFLSENFLYSGYSSIVSGDSVYPMPFALSDGTVGGRIGLFYGTNGAGDMLIRAFNRATVLNGRHFKAVIKYTKTTDTATRSLNATLNTMNTGSLVGMGDRAEVSEQVDEKVSEQVTDNDVGEQTKSAEVDKLESEEGSGDSR